MFTIHSLTSERIPSHIKGILCMLISSLFIALSGIILKILSPKIPALESFFIRSAFGIIFLVPFMFYKQINLIGNNRIQLCTRGIIGSLAGMCFYTALATAPMAESSTLFRCAALYIPFLAFFIIKEQLSFSRFLYAVLGIMGTLLILKPGFQNISSGLIVAFLGGLLSSFAFISVRSLSSKESSFTIVLYFQIFSTLFSAILLNFNFVIPDISQMLLLSLIVVFGLSGQLFLTKSYSYADASILAPIGYFEILIFTLSDYLITKTIPDFFSFIGILIIIGMGTLITINK